MPFRSDGEVSPSAAVMYDEMYPKHGYRVMRNPKTVQETVDGVPINSVPGGEHVYRVEPPGQHTNKTFYSNPAEGGMIGGLLGAQQDKRNSDDSESALLDYIKRRQQEERPLLRMLADPNAT